MGYPAFGKIKTLTLPIPSQPMTLEEYKERYGIDLLEYVSLSDGGYINFNAHNSYVLLSETNYENEGGDDEIVLNCTNIIIPIASVVVSVWDSGKNDAETKLGIYNPSDGTMGGLMFSVSKNQSFTLDNVKIGPKSL